MFDGISSKYDFLNHFLSFGADRSWRKRVRTELDRRSGGRFTAFSILDVAAGTGDLSLELARGNPAEIVGIDISANMLAIAREKTAALHPGDRIRFIEGQAEHLPFDSGRFDAVTAAFGVRNFENIYRGISEMARVLKPGGILLILEFSHPSWFPLAQLYRFYSKAIIPRIGKWISRHEGAYSYLPASAAAFPSGRPFLDILERNGLRNTEQIPLTGGIVSVYCAEK